ncbi:MAG: PilZ domain-containing protein [Candidatus Omnitrophica bacterium]|nr:PilZ domain-containing protein [Candidatus Omnitrophota bacterium]
MAEKRKFPRLNVADVIVNWRKETSLDSTAKSKNISGGGICLILDKSDALAPGDLLQIEFHLPKGQIIYSKARVAWTDSFEVIHGTVDTQHEAGIEFFDISAKDREAISHYVLTRLPAGKKNSL